MAIRRDVHSSAHAGGDVHWKFGRICTLPITISLLQDVCITGLALNYNAAGKPFAVGAPPKEGGMNVHVSMN